MSSLNRLEQNIETNYSAAEPSKKSLTTVTAFANGTAQSIHTTSVSSALINNSVHSVEVSRGPFVSGAVATSNMIMKTESQDSESSCTDDSTSGLDWKPDAKKLRINDGAVDYSMTSPSYSSTDSSNANSSGINGGSRRSTGSKRSGRDDKLSPEDEERRKVRRERNKVAAAKCRQKRVDQTNQLLDETKTLEEEQSRLQDEIKSFQQQKEELEFLLEAHRVHCGAAIQPTLQNNTVLPIKSEGMRTTETEMAPSQLTQSAGLRRPNMIPIGTPLTSSAMNELTMTNVPTSGFFVLGLQSMINGHTGLTPLTGLPPLEMVSTPDGGRGTSSSFDLSSDTKLTML